MERGRDYKLITEVTQNGDTFSWTQVYPTDAKVTNTFTIGKECDMETIGGKKFKVKRAVELLTETRMSNSCLFRPPLSWREAS